MKSLHVAAVATLCFIACNSSPDAKSPSDEAGASVTTRLLLPVPKVQGTTLATYTSDCPADMIQVTGEYCTNLEEICLKWADPDNKGANGPVQCLEFKQPTRCLGPTVHLNYCVDKYPYPNKPEELPTTNLSWFQAQDLCKAQGKRLCNMKEFTQACRGPENKPYPYGYTRDCSKCNCDKTPWLDPSTHTFAELDKRVPLGSMPECRSDYGVMDTVGNNDRWVENETKHPYVSALKGGHAVQGARNRCSPTTFVHGPDFSYYETGALCCKDIP
jgi:formylglycine-generating enzyme